jgi:hypothetical protein
MNSEGRRRLEEAGHCLAQAIQGLEAIDRGLHALGVPTAHGWTVLTQVRHAAAALAIISEQVSQNEVELATLRTLTGLGDQPQEL